jgi:pSer/pThr/pTyr-binding forkhead associated (FHA) protein
VGGRVGDALLLTLGTPPTTFTVARTSATLGRGQENTIRLDDLSVSRRHARIAYRQGGYWLSDLGSMGGTWVDGTRLNAPRRIAFGEVIDIGLCRLTVSFGGGAAKGETKKSASKPQPEVAAQVRRRR